MNTNEENVRGELQRITSLLAEVESNLSYILDRSSDYGIKVEDVRTAHALSKSALNKWLETIESESTNE